MDCNKIFETIELNCIKENEKIAGLVIDEILAKIEKRIFFFNDDDLLIQRLGKFKRNFIYSSEYLEVFFEILEKYGYNPKREIIEAITRLGLLNNPKNNSELINKLLLSPFIDDISFDGKGKYTITSEEFGIITFSLASHVFRHNKNMRNYIENNPLPRRCHNHTLFTRAVFPAYYAVTALCPAPFKGRYYHSFTYNSEEHDIIDLCSNAVISTDDYGTLYSPNIISIVQNNKITKELKITKKNTNQPDERFVLLKIALYKQMLTLQARQKDPNSPKILTLK